MGTDRLLEQVKFKVQRVFIILEGNFVVQSADIHTVHKQQQTQPNMHEYNAFTKNDVRGQWQQEQVSFMSVSSAFWQNVSAARREQHEFIKEGVAWISLL